VPEIDEVIASFKRVSETVGAKAMSWRYDPIFIADKYSVDVHIQKFEYIAAQLAGYTEHCVISFIDLYEKTKRNFPEVRAVGRDDRLRLGAAFAEIGRKHGIRIYSCCEGKELAVFGVDTSGCLTKEVVEAGIGEKLTVPGSVKSKRTECNCLLGSDIGAYNTCPHGCIYCYANYNWELVQQNVRLHDPKSSFLIGGERDDDVVKEAKQESYIDGQMTMFL